MMNDGIDDLSAAMAGNREAFARLYDRHGGMVLSLCRHKLSLSEAEDATQETFLRAYRQLDHLKNPSAFRAWLYGIARRVAAERCRSSNRRMKHETRAVMRQVDTNNDSKTTGHRIDQAEQLERLSEALDQLPDNERLAVHLYYLDPNPVGVACSVSGLSRSGFYKLLARARKHLASYMREVQTP